MTEDDIRILRLLSVPLTREKQFALQRELERYHTIVNRVIRSVLKKRISTMKKTLEVLGGEIRASVIKDLEENPSPQYIQQYTADVVKTARVEIGRHKRLARTIRSMRDKTPRFKRDRLIVSYPIIRVQKKTLLLIPPSGEMIPIPFDKHSRNQVIKDLGFIEDSQRKGESGCERVRIIMNKAGYADIAIRMKS